MDTQLTNKEMAQTLWKTATLLREALGVSTAEGLAEAVRSGRAAGVYGVDPKRLSDWGQLSRFEQEPTLALVPGWV